MGWGKVVLVLVVLQTTSTLLLQRAAGDSLAPFLAPVINATCDMVECGKGTCKSSLNYTLGFVCECNTGWSQFNYLSFSACVIPNCSINYSCYNSSEPPASSPAPPLTKTSILDPCFWSYCGGGKCVKTSTLDHQCECEEGFSNLLNITRFPCYKDCSLGADCRNLGITLSNTTSPAPSPSLSDNGNSFAGDSLAPNNLLWLFILMISLVMVRAT